MCGRYSFFIPADDWEEFVNNRVNRDIQLPDNYKPRYNVAPQQDMPVYSPQVDESQLVYMKWGLVPFYADDDSDYMINARDDKVLESNAWKKSFEERRCLVPADGFYEWKKLNGGKQPYRIRDKDNEPFFMAGLYREWKPNQKQTTLFGDKEFSPVPTYAIITCDANDVIKGIHDRMPAIIEPDNVTSYLEGSTEEAHELLDPYSEESTDAYPVSPEVNNPSNDNPDVIIPKDL